MIANYHTHTWRCRHADGTEREYVERAIEGGLKILGFSDHSPYPFPDGYDSGMRMRLDQVEGYVDTVLALKKEYDKVAYALEEVKRKGYGIVSPTVDELSLEEPEIVKQGGRFGVRLRASAPSIHMIAATVETEVNPVVGTEKQSEELVHYLLSEFDTDPKRIWESNIFGKSLHELVNEGMHNKLARMPEDARGKVRETIERIINDGCNGLICIIL